jgi:hypothetical protein
MRVNLSSNVGQLLVRMKDRATDAPRALSNAARESAPLLQAEARRVLQSEVYAVPIPLTRGANARLRPGSRVRQFVSKGRHGKWRRFGTLLGGERAEAEGPHIVMQNTAGHAGARAALGQANPPNRAGRLAGIQRRQTGPAEEQSHTRPVQWQQMAVKNLRARVLEIRRKHVKRMLERR